MKLTDILNEADELPKRTRTRTKPLDFDLNPPDNSDKQLSAPNQDALPTGSIPQRRASKPRTQAALRNVSMTGDTAERLGSLGRSGMQSKISDTDAARISGQEDEPKTPGTDLVIPSRTQTLVNPNKAEWHAVRHLPGYLANGIRAMGEMIFSKFTTTEISDIDVLANLNGQGPNSQEDIDFVASEVRDAADPSSIVEISSGELANLIGVPYKAKCVQFDYKGDTFLMVKDHMGSYVYKWPLSTTISPFSGSSDGEKLALPSSPPRRLR